jgi:D-beta-D-heptose 7-phosphate kinase/D-beta-D-heptose 1-phosphate adenosyltransferase
MRPGIQALNEPFNLSVDRARSLLSGCSGRHILVLGDVMLDRYLWGTVSRISPEAPVPVVEVETETVRLGGAANVAHNVSALGALPHLVGVVGTDAASQVLREELAARGLGVDGLVLDGSRPTSIKTRIVARHQQVVRADQESREEVSGETEEQLVKKCRDRIPELEACVISDYGKGVITRRLLSVLLPELKRAGVAVCVDPKETHFFSYTGVSVITPNLIEAGTAFGRALKTDELLNDAGEDLVRRLACDAVLITRGEKGMSLFEAGRARLDLPTVAREVYDVTGAGDTVVSHYALALAAGASHPEAACLANHAAGIVVREVGTATATCRQILDSFARED